MNQIEDTRDRLIREQNNELSKKNAEIITLKQNIRNVEENRPEITPDLDISLDCKRLDAAIRRATKRQRKTSNSDETFIKLANCMAYLIQVKMPIADKILNLSSTLKRLNK